MKILVIGLLLALAGPHEDNKQMVFDMIGYEEHINMGYTTILFSDTDAATVPDGTTATTGNTGLEGITNTVNTAKWATHADGSRYITGMSGSTPANGSQITVTLEDSTTVNAATSIVCELLIEYVGTAPDNTIQNYANLNSGGSVYRTWHRTNSVWDQRMKVQWTVSGPAASGTTVRKLYGEEVEMGKKNWLGTIFHKDASDGMVGATINGNIVHVFTGIDSSAITNFSGLAAFNPMFGPSLNYRIYGYRYSTSGDIADVLEPTFDTDTENAVRILDQMIPEIGPYEQTSGAGSLAFETDSTGVVSKLWRAKSSGGAVTLGLRSQHAIGDLRSLRGRACFGYTYLKAAAATVVDIRLTDQTSGDVGILTMRGDLGTASTRPIYLDAEDTGVTYDETHSYIPMFVFDTQDNQSAVVLFDQTNNSASEQHVFPIDWDRTGGIPAINDMIITMYGADCYIGLPFHVPLANSNGPSSWSATPKTIAGVDHSIPNHITAGFDAFPNHGYLSEGYVGFLNWGRSGLLAEYTKPWWGDFDNMSRMRWLPMTFVDNSINDLNSGRTVAQVLANFQEIVDMAVANDIPIQVMSNVLLPAGGSHSWDDTYRGKQEDVNEGILAIQIAANRPDLMFYAAVRESFATQAEMDALFTPATDDTHPNDAGDIILRDLFVSLLAPVGEFAVSNRSRDRGRDR